MHLLSPSGPISPTSSLRRTPFHIPSLDGIRAVAFAIVFLSHGVDERVPGGFGVTIFFFLSGYLITTLLRREHEKTGTIRLSAFYARRALRVFPNFYLVLLVATALGFAGVLTFAGGEPAAWGLFWQALYGNNYYGIFASDRGTVLGTGVFWSLAIEEHFYLLFPACFLVLAHTTVRRTVQCGAIAALCALVLAWRYVLVYVADVPHDAYTYKATDARVDSMLFGCMLAIVGNPALDRSRVSDRVWLWAGVPLGLLMLLVTFAVRDEIFRWTLRYTVQGIALIPLFVAAIRCHQHPLVAWLNWRWVRYVGVLTYTLYLVHLVIIFRVQQLLPATGAGRLAAAAAALAISFVIAVVVHHAVERPLAAWRKRLHAERPVPAASE